MEKRDILISFFLPSLHGGGAERVIVNLAKGFSAKKIHVDLVLAKAEGPYLVELPKEVRVIDLKSSRVSTSLPKLIRYLKREKPNVMISSLSHANIVAILANKFARTNTKIVVREDSTLSLSSTNSSSLKGRIIPFLVKIFYRWADVIIAVSEGVKEDLIKSAGLSSDKIKVIYNPVITPELFEKTKEPVPHPWFAPKEPPIILGVGRLTKSKDFGTLMKAFSLIRKDIKARLVILGEGEERRNLENITKNLGIENDVWLPGFVNNPYKFMSKASVFVLSSIFEGLSTVIIEAMACGTTVVSTDCESGPREILEDGKYGKLVPVGDYMAMAQAIEEILTGKVRYEVPKSVLEQYTLEFSLNQYIKLLFENGIYKYEE